MVAGAIAARVAGATSMVAGATAAMVAGVAAAAGLAAAGLAAGLAAAAGPVAAGPVAGAIAAARPGAVLRRLPGPGPAVPRRLPGRQCSDACPTSGSPRAGPAASTVCQPVLIEQKLCSVCQFVTVCPRRRRRISTPTTSETLRGNRGDQAPAMLPDRVRGTFCPCFDAGPNEPPHLQACLGEDRPEVACGIGEDRGSTPESALPLELERYVQQAGMTAFAKMLAAGRAWRASSHAWIVRKAGDDI